MSIRSYGVRGNTIRHTMPVSRVRFISPDLTTSELPPDRDIKLDLQPLKDLDLMIENGWGDTPQDKLPEDWRTRKKGAKSC